MNRNINLLKEVKEQFTAEHWRRYGSLIEATLELVQSHQHSRQALKDLVRSGCNPAVLLRELGLYLSGADEFWNRRARYARTQLKAISARLESDAEILTRIISEFMEESPEQYGDVVHTPTTLRYSAKSLKDALSTLTKHTHGKTGTTKHLVYLSYHINVATKRKHYKELAQLIGCGDLSENVVKLADSLRHEIRGHEKQFPQLFKGEREVIEGEFRAWHKWLDSRKSTETQLS